MYTTNVQEFGCHSSLCFCLSVQFSTSNLTRKRKPFFSLKSFICVYHIIMFLNFKTNLRYLLFSNTSPPRPWYWQFTHLVRTPCTRQCSTVFTNAPSGLFFAARRHWDFVYTLFTYHVNHSIFPRTTETFGFLPQLDEFYFTTGEKKILEHYRWIVPSFIND